MLTFDRVSFQYDVEDFSIIDDLSFRLEKGEFFFLIGNCG